MATYFIIRDGKYAPGGPCPLCHGDDWDCYPGEYPVCRGCNVKMIRLGRAPRAKCVTPNGRIDSHFSYVNSSPRGLVCAFCGEPCMQPAQHDQEK